MQEQRSWRAWLRVGVIKGLRICRLLCGRCLVQNTACDTACYETGWEVRENRVLLLASSRNPGSSWPTARHKWLRYCHQCTHLSTNPCDCKSAQHFHPQPCILAATFQLKYLLWGRKKLAHFTILVNLPFPYTVEKKNSGETLFISFLISFKVW